LAVFICFVAMLVAAAAAPFAGSARIDFARAFHGQSPDYEILFFARMPRVLLSLIAGGALAVAGVLFQALLRDALATPYTLGVSSGASLGAVIAIVFSLRPIWLSAIAGAACTLLLVVSIASESRRISSFTLLLTGVTLNSFCLALILFLQNVSSFGQSFAIVRWLMGSIDAVPYQSIVWLTVVLVPICVIVSLRAREWNLLAVGEEWAHSRGVVVPRVMLFGYVAGSILAGAITAFTGPIAFIGLIVPHALRLRFGSDHRLLLPCSFFLGAGFLIVCDTVARTVLAPTEVPVGVVTALLGGPFFIWLLRSKRRSLWI
jgi:iron complex transport system permease protein